ncbi:hypothetical protein [Streptomyces sp. NPDC016626]|uniref:hypothetical protein n=1 Tax=Streptomyces sp. NPDC016626 TaxID=3364968 RepID=UPI0036FC55F2
MQQGLLKADAVRNTELWPVSQTGMIGVLMMHRQYSLQKKFLFFVRNFRNSSELGGDSRRRRLPSIGGSVMPRRLGGSRSRGRGGGAAAVRCRRSVRRSIASAST